MKITTWNVNSIKTRAGHVGDWLDANAPDIICLQELKGMDFPHDAFTAKGYSALVNPQKAYNGVALLSRAPLDEVSMRLPGDDTDEQARFIHARADGFDVIGIYAPNGNPVDSDKYPYKLRWLDRLIEYTRTLMDTGRDIALMGDFNIIPEARDCFDANVWRDDALFRLESRRHYRALINMGLTDALAARRARADEYTFWDYQGGCWQQNKGIRIDHILLTPRLADRLQTAAADRTPRGWEQPSDHIPVTAVLADPA